ncbi:uncharacterized protein LOC127143759 isoform X2 [Cucumis melo]|uniref:Uncharacterized protein LOC127143759 isoform X2 n=1 Tax=Cucumis melo TaxID=3656 RepID=A0ABM3KXF7_CUCME|nr:uncharacterized protein LOC127143759 isoform X2 [Cucumis melo]
MYSAIPALPMDDGGGKFQGSLDGTNLLDDACLVLTSDLKSHLHWMVELHERYVDAVTQLDGPDIACETNSGCYHAVQSFKRKLVIFEFEGGQGEKDKTTSEIQMAHNFSLPPLSPTAEIVIFLKLESWKKVCIFK